jgi:hypothetical protein
MWYKAEAYTASEYAGKHLYDNGLTPIYVSDNPVLNAQHVLFEAAKAYKYGLPYHAALASVTTAPAERLGLGQRLGKVKAGFDADVVVWDSDPLSVGAAPVQVWVDGTSQIKNPVQLAKPAVSMIVPDETLGENLVGESDPVVIADDDVVVFTGIKKVLLPVSSVLDGVSSAELDESNGKPVNVAVTGGKITCIGECALPLATARKSKNRVISLRNGYLSSGMTALGSTLGLNAIDAERDTDNGPSTSHFSRAIDGLALDTEKLIVGHRYGVTRAISAPKFTGGGTHHGTSVAFLTGAKTSTDPGAVVEPDAAVHYTLTLSAKRADGGGGSISGAVGLLRAKLLEAASSNKTTEAKDAFSEQAFLQKVVSGELPLVVTVHSADTISALLRLKEEIESVSGSRIRLGIIGGAESHLVAEKLAAARVGVVLAPFRSYRTSWDQRRALTGAPLTNGTAVDALVAAGVTVAIGLEEDWVVRDLGLFAGIGYVNSQGSIGEKEALALVSSNVDKILGLDTKENGDNFVVYEGSPLEIGGRVKAVAGGLGRVSIWI